MTLRTIFTAVLFLLLGVMGFISNASFLNAVEVIAYNSIVFVLVSLVVVFIIGEILEPTRRDR